MQRTFILITILAIFSITGEKTLLAQWEKIGWEGGGQVEIKAQLGNTLYGIVNYSVYKSTDWGKTWIMFHEGLPNDISFFQLIENINIKSYLPHHYLTFRTWKDYLIIDPYELNYSGEPVPYGFYYCKELDTKWYFHKLLPVVDGENQPHILFFSSDSIFLYDDLSVTDAIGYYFSNNGGITYKHRMTVMNGPWDYDYPAFFVKSNFFAQGHHKMYITRNFGMNWDSTVLPLAENLQQTDFYRSNPYVLKDSIIIQFFAVQGDTTSTYGLFRSADLGVFWQQINLPANLSSSSKITFLKTIGTRTFMQVMTDNYSSLLVSENLGIHWKLIPLSTKVSMTNIWGKENFYLMITSDSILITDNTFSSFYPLERRKKGIMANGKTLVGVDEKNLFALPDTQQGTFYDSIMLSTDNGTTWDVKSLPNGVKFDLHRRFKNGKFFYASGIQRDSFPSLFKSDDDGNTWSLVMKFANEQTIKQCFIQGDTMIVRRERDYLLSIDGGKSWLVKSDVNVNDSVMMFYQDGLFALLNINSGALLTSKNLGQNWDFENPYGQSYYPPNIGLYIFGNRIFIYPSNVLAFKEINTDNWRLSFIVPGSEHNFFFPNMSDGSVLYALNFSGFGFTKLYLSLDSGMNWKEEPGNVTNSSNIFIGSEYIFLAGPTELWRAPKSILKLNVSANKSASSLSLTCFPNPAQDEIDILYHTSQKGDIAISAYDINGKFIASIVNENQNELSSHTNWKTRNLPSGTYIIELYSHGEKISQEVKVIH
jgi:hypothetical protein